MFCPKCGTQNPEEGKFCRSCGSDLGNVSSALSGVPPQRLVNHKGKPVHLEGAITKMFTGLAFLIIAVVLSFSAMGMGWWFWMLIPAFGSLGAGIAQFIQLREAKKNQTGFAPQPGTLPPTQNSALPPQQTGFVPPPESRYKTGDLVPPSVTDATTRHLEIDSEGQTMTLPKK
jgi:zinc-ribbon domain